MRTILDIPDEQATRLDALVKKMKTSRAALIRKGIDLVLQEEEQEAMSRAGAFGMWKPKVTVEKQPVVSESASEKTVPVEAAASENIEPLELDNVVENTDAPLAFEAIKAKGPDMKSDEKELVGVESEATASPEIEVDEVAMAAPAVEAEPELEAEAKEKTPASPPPSPAAGGDIWPASFFSTVVSPDTSEDEA